jgi:hypothetical protein
MTYSPPYFYIGLYEEESKAFKIVDRRSEDLWIALLPTEAAAPWEPIADCPGYETATGAMIAAQLKWERLLRGDGSGALA